MPVLIEMVVEQKNLSKRKRKRKRKVSMWKKVVIVWEVVCVVVVAEEENDFWKGCFPLKKKKKEVVVWVGLCFCSAVPKSPHLRFDLQRILQT